MGPPRQATGPTRSGAGVGVGMLRGYHHVSKKLTEQAIHEPEVILIKRK